MIKVWESKQIQKEEVPGIVDDYIELLGGLVEQYTKGKKYIAIENNGSIYTLSPNEDIVERKRHLLLGRYFYQSALDVYAVDESTLVFISLDDGDHYQVYSTDHDMRYEQSKHNIKQVAYEKFVADTFVCDCGNTIFDDDFATCDKRGNPKEPYGNWEGYYQCKTCEQIYHVTVSKDIYRYLGENITFSFGKYAMPENTAIFLDMLNGEEFTVATVNIDQELPSNTVAIKNYGENENIFDFLAKAGIIEDEILFEIPSGFVMIPVVRLTKKGINLKDEDII